MLAHHTDQLDEHQPHHCNTGWPKNNITTPFQRHTIRLENDKTCFKIYLVYLFLNCEVLVQNGVNGIESYSKLIINVS